MRIPIKFFIVTLISAKPVFSFPESIPINEIISTLIPPEPLFSLPENKAAIPDYPKTTTHYTPFILGLGLGAVVFTYADEISRELYDLYEEYPKILSVLITFGLVQAPSIYNFAQGYITFKDTLTLGLGLTTGLFSSIAYVNLDGISRGLYDLYEEYPKILIPFTIFGLVQAPSIYNFAQGCITFKGIFTLGLGLTTVLFSGIAYVRRDKILRDLYDLCEKYPKTLSGLITFGLVKAPSIYNFAQNCLRCKNPSQFIALLFQKQQDLGIIGLVPVFFSFVHWSIIIFFQE